MFTSLEVLSLMDVASLMHASINIEVLPLSLRHHLLNTNFRPPPGLSLLSSSTPRQSTDSLATIHSEVTPPATPLLLPSSTPPRVSTTRSSSFSDCSTTASTPQRESPQRCLLQTFQGGKRGGTGLFKSVYRISVPLKYLEEFQFVPRFIGLSGCNTKAIASTCNGKVRLRGRGSGHFEAGGKEANISLQVALSCGSVKEHQTGDAMLRDLLDRIAEEYRIFCERISVKAPKRFYHSAAK